MTEGRHVPYLEVVERPSHHERMLDSARILCIMSMFAFVVFGIVDPLIVEGSIFPLVLVRAYCVAIGMLLLLLSNTTIGRNHPTIIGELITVVTGVGVVVLTEKTGGADSFYWMMILLLFFTVALIFPMTIKKGVLYFGGVAVFFDVWMVSQNAMGSDIAWISSNAGIWLSAVISIATVKFLGDSRNAQGRYEQELLKLNHKLFQEIIDRQKAEAEQRKAEEELLESQKLDALGRLSAGIAHEVNNVLTTIVCSVELLRQEEVTQSSYEINLNRIQSAAESGSKLVGDLLRFSRKGIRESKLFSLLEVVEDIVHMLRKTNRNRCFVLDAPMEPKSIKGDPQLFFQVLLNLCLNSIDASEGSEAITIRVRNIPPDKENNALIKVMIIDNGTGMTEEVQAKAFEPFFTTKEAGQGTGLGLSMVYGTIQDHNGEVQLDSIVGKGTTVTITLPSFGEYLSQDVDDPIAESSLEKATILVVDDDSMVRDLLAEILSNTGHKVKTASSGEQALDLYDDSIDLVVMDVIMPNENGTVVYQKIQQTNPHQKVIFCSGYSDSSLLGVLLLEPQCHLLSKPFQTRQLLKLVSSLVVR